MNAKTTNSHPIKTVLTITLGMLVIYFITKWKWSLNLALVVGILGLFSKYLATKIDFLWMKLTWVLSLIVPNILLTIVFFLALTPIAWFSKLFGKKNQLSVKNRSDSLFKEYNKQFEKASFEKVW